jgi:hypothetical protein
VPSPQTAVPVLQLVHGQQANLETADKVAGVADIARAGVRVVTGTNAFRVYDALANNIGRNSAGNFRGMVVSARWRMLYQLSSDSKNLFGNLGYLASLAGGLAEAAPEIEAISSSNNGAGTKALKLTVIAGRLSQRALLGVIPTGVHLIYKSLEGWCMLAGLAGGPLRGPSASAVQTLQSADTLVQTTFLQVTDPNNQAEAIWTVINFVASKKR